MSTNKNNKKSKKLKVSANKKKSKALPSLGKPHKIALLILLALTFIFFSPSLQNSYVNWDDDRNFYNNDLITGLDQDNFWKNSKKIFVTPVIGNYNPLSIWTFAVEAKIFGIDDTFLGQPSMFFWHLNNLLLHLICVLMVFLIALKMKVPFPAILLLTSLFAVHPMRVESVAWLTERKDVLFGAFYFIALYFYILYTQKEQKKRYLVSIWVCFILSLFSKIQAVILPISFILIDYWFDGKLSVPKMLRKSPYLLTSLLFGVLGIYLLKDQGSLESTANFEGIERVFIGSFSYLVYLVKSIVPYRLSALYPYPSSMPVYFYPTILLFIGLPFLLIYLYRKNYKVGFFGLSFFTANIFFLLQILGAGQGFLADRFSYVAYFGLFLIYSVVLVQWAEKFNAKKWSHYLFIIPMLVYGVMTFNQTKVWKNSGTLWSHVIQYYKNATLPYGNRANYYRDQGQTAAALKDYSASISLLSTKPDVYNSRGKLYFNFDHQDSLQKALSDYTKAIELSPDTAEFYVNRGATYSKLKLPEKAIQDLNTAIEKNPNAFNAYLNRSVVYNSMGNLNKALEDIDQYLRFKPNVADIQYQGGLINNSLHRYSAALPYFNKAIQLKPNVPGYHFERAKARYSTNDKKGAQQDIQYCIQLGAEIPPEVYQRIMSN